MEGLLMFNIEPLQIKSYRRDYAVNFAPIDEDLLSSYDNNTFVIIDSNIEKLYPVFREYFAPEKMIIVEALEQNKTLQMCEKIITILSSRNFRRNHKLLAIGGGIIQDLTAFTASIIYRGVEWHFFPTTLLAQSDSCIGSKSSINFAETKNALGTFYPPSQIVCCPQFLDTLNTDDIKSGIGEILHYYLIENSELVNDFGKDYENILNDPTQHLAKYVAESLRIKKTMIEKDEFDENERKVFNYGHTFGHAIEAISNYKISHGLAVTIGMDLANYISLRKKIINRQQYERLYTALKRNLIRYRVPQNLESKYYSLLLKDKKNVDDSIVCVLPYNIGDIRVTSINNHRELKNIIHEYMSGNLCL
jgi:3-dehydroquinate synthase